MWKYDLPRLRTRGAAAAPMGCAHSRGLDQAKGESRDENGINDDSRQLRNPDGMRGWSNAQKGTAIGAGTGAVSGNVVGGRVLGTVGGAAVGGVVGQEIGKD